MKVLAASRHNLTSLNKFNINPIYIHKLSILVTESPHVQSCVWEYIATNTIPVLGICYGMQEMAHVFGGAVEPSTEREFGRAFIDVTEENAEVANVLFAGVNHSQMWMSHGGTRMHVAPANIHTWTDGWMDDGWLGCFFPLLAHPLTHFFFINICHLC